MKKHILFIVENAPVPLDKRVWYEALAAREWGYEVSVISPKMRGATRKFERLDRINVYRHPMPVEADGKLGFMIEYSNALLWEFLLSLWIFLKKPFYYIHAANPPDHIFLIGLFFKMFGVSFIFDHHDICPENYVAKFDKKDLFYRLLLLMEKLTFKTADLVISTNESYKKIAITRGNRHPDDVFVVRNGPDLSKVIFAEPNEALKEGCDYLVAYVGVIGNQEGIDILLKVVHHIVYTIKRKDIKFVVIGTGPDWNNMVESSREMNLDKFVEFTGFIPYTNFYEYLATADLCVNPESTNPFTDKSTMIKIMDYMVFGKPIVQFETTEGKVTAKGASSYIQDNDIRQFAETILELLDDPEKRCSMGEIGKRRSSDKLNWDKQKLNLRAAYQHLETSK